MVHFFNSFLNPKKPTITIPDKEDYPIEEGVTLMVDTLTLASSNALYFIAIFVDSCWSTESTYNI